MSHRSGSASSALRIGLANASPTIDRLFTRRACTVSSSSTASKCRPTVVTIEPASASVHIALNAPVPCINGAAGMFDGPGLDTRASNSSHPGDGRERPLRRRVEAGEHVVLAPHHALGHPRRPAGVQQVEVVGRAAPRRADASWRRRRGHRVVDRPVRARRRAVVHPDPALHRRHPLAHRRAALGERRRGRSPPRRRRCSTGSRARPRCSGSSCSPGRTPPCRSRTSTRGTRGSCRGSAPPSTAGPGPAASSVAAMPSARPVELRPRRRPLPLDLGHCLREPVGVALPHIGEVPAVHVIS